MVSGFSVLLAAAAASVLPSPVLPPPTEDGAALLSAYGIHNLTSAFEVPVLSKRAI
jgi:hypothetical protein